jgi:hypothetical protein
MESLTERLHWDRAWDKFVDTHTKPTLTSRQDRQPRSDFPPVISPAATMFSVNHRPIGLRRRVIAGAVLWLFVTSQWLGLLGCGSRNGHGAAVAESLGQGACCCSRQAQTAGSCCCSAKSPFVPDVPACCATKPGQHRSEQPSHSPTQRIEPSLAPCLCGHAPTDNALLASVWLPKLLADSVSLNGDDTSVWLGGLSPHFSMRDGVPPTPPPPKTA